MHAMTDPYRRDLATSHVSISGTITRGDPTLYVIPEESAMTPSRVSDEGSVTLHDFTIGPLEDELRCFDAINVTSHVHAEYGYGSVWDDEDSGIYTIGHYPPRLIALNITGVGEDLGADGARIVTDIEDTFAFLIARSCLWDEDLEVKLDVVDRNHADASLPEWVTLPADNPSGVVPSEVVVSIGPFEYDRVGRWEDSPERSFRIQTTFYYSMESYQSFSPRIYVVHGPSVE